MQLTDRIIYEDNHLIAVNKQCGELVQQDNTTTESLENAVREFIRQRDKKPGNVFLGVIHRLDRPVSGVVVFAKTGKALVRMNECVRDRRFKKTYWAVTAGRPAEPRGQLKGYIRRSPRDNKVAVYDKPVPESKEAILDYELLACADRYNLLEIDLHTGRHHQIRAQLSQAGWPIKGDLKYGAPRSNNNGGISLHARSVEFLHPVTKEEVRITAQPPVDPLWDHFKRSVAGTL